MKKINIWALALLIVVALSACNTDGLQASSKTSAPSISKSSESNENTEGVPEITSTATDEKEMPTFESLEQILKMLERNSPPVGRDVMMAEAEFGQTDGIMEAAPSNSGTADTPSKGDYSSTNTQVEGVDEGEIIKTDGKYIYVLTADKIQIVEADNGKMELVSSIELGEEDKYRSSWGWWGHRYGTTEVYVVGDRLVTVGTRSETVVLPQLPYDPKNEKEEMYRGLVPDYNIINTVYNVYDISNRQSLKHVDSLIVSGNTVATRVIGDTLYYVTSYSPAYYANWGLYREYGIDIKDEWVLPYTVNYGGEGKVIIPADRIKYFPDSLERSFLSVGTLDITGKTKSEPKVYFGGGSNFYMNTEYAVVACENSGQWDWWGRGQSNWTDLYKFAVGKDGFVLTSSGKVEGKLLNQYSMDMHDGNFRVATTVGWGAENHIWILNKNMEELGVARGIAPGEQIKSARFLGDMAYVVTFRNMDPLFAIDLSNPAKPNVIGELKIPGFSQYLHPIGDDLLIGFGRHTKEIVRIVDGKPQVSGFEDVGSKISLFDISNPKDPREADVIVYEEDKDFIYSEAFENPRAIMVHAERQLFGFPVIAYDGDASQYQDIDLTKFWYGGMFISVENGNKLREVARTEQGRLKDGDLEMLESSGGEATLWGRTVYIGNTMYQTGGGKMKSFYFDTFAPISEINLK